MSAPSLFELRKTLSAAAMDDPGQPAHARAYSEWIRHSALDQSPVLRLLVTEAATLDGAARQTAHAAVLGFGANLDASCRPAFADALDWLRRRQYFVPTRTPTYEIDGLGLLGTAVGIVALHTDVPEPARRWLAQLSKQALNLQRRPDWNASLIAATVVLMDGEAATGVSDFLSSDLRIALAAKHLLSATAASRDTAWALISGLEAADDGMTRAATQAASLASLLRDASALHFGAISVDDVARVLAGVDRSMRRWTWDTAPRTPRSAVARWEIENEYHVQDMLWAILAPVFPDLDDEEWLKSLGQHHPRADLAIPSLDLIIEVKFLRAGGKSVFNNVIEQVAADASTYLQEGSGYRHLIAFVWDDLARTEEHAELRQGLMHIRGVKDAIILPRPAKMDRRTRGEQAARGPTSSSSKVATPPCK